MAGAHRTESCRILVVDDEEPIRNGLSHLITRLGHTVDLAADAEQAIAKAGASPPDMIITDLQLPGMSGLELIEALREQGVEATLVVLTAYGSIDSAVEATRRGVFDYLVKPVEADRLTTVIRKGLERASMRREVQALRREMVRSGRFQTLAGKSPSMLAIYRLIEQVAPTSAPVLIAGESGTGKEVVARSIHALSNRSAASFVALSCAAIPETLLESEILGHEKGAFTGATASRAGCFELADHGTIFLDEIGEMPVALQAKLLRVLEDGRVRRVGGSREIPVDTRVIAATNANIEEKLRAGEFREDLFFRLNVFHLQLPPLRERREDIPVIAQMFLEQYARENGRLLAGFSEEAMSLLVGYDWPGNVRELRNVVQRAVILCPEGEIRREHLPGNVRPGVRNDAADPGALKVAIGSSLAEVEEALILRTLEASNGNKTRAAAVLGISAKTLHMKLRQYRETRRGRGPSGAAR